MSETFPVYDQSGQRLAEQGGIKLVKFPKAGGESGYTTAAYSVSAGNDYADAYAPIRAETSALSVASLRYTISNIPIPWKLDSEGGVHDFYVVAISSDGEIVEDVSNVYLSYDNATSTLTIQPLFGSKDFCVYVFRDEQAINLFAIKADGNANIASILAQFEKDNRVLKQLQALSGRAVRAPDEMAILPEAEYRKNKVLAFDENGQPSVWLSIEDIKSVYDARDEVLAALATIQGLAEQVSQDKKASETARNSAQGYASSSKNNADKSLAAFEGAVDAAESAEADAQKVAAALDEQALIYTPAGEIVDGERGLIVPVKVSDTKYAPSFKKKDNA